MQNYRSYGNKPYTIALIHGGPGATGEMEPVAKHLSASVSIIEPFQTQKTIQGLLDELKSLLQEPIILVGYSWGAMLSVLFASQNPTLVKKLILIGCPPLDTEHAKTIMPMRLSRLNPEDRQLLLDSVSKLENTSELDKQNLVESIVSLISKADQFNPEPKPKKMVDFQLDIYESIWPEVVVFREKGGFIESLKNIDCPVTLIHGEHDPHPLKALDLIASYLKNVQILILKKCGHTPWLEKEAKDAFYELIKKEFSKF